MGRTAELEALLIGVSNPHIDEADLEHGADSDALASPPPVEEEVADDPYASPIPGLKLKSMGVVGQNRAKGGDVE